MTNFLIKLFVTGKSANKDKSSPALRQRYSTLASITGIVVNLLLFAAKLTAGILAASVAVKADAFNNVSDAGSAVIVLIGFRLSLKPVDKDHPWGHGRLEYVTGFVVDMLIILVGVELLKSSAEKIIRPVPTNVTALTLILLGVAILAKLWLFFFYRKIGNTIDSAVIKGTAIDSVSDVVATSLVLLSSLVSKFSGVSIDGWAGVIVAGFIVFSGFKAAKETIDLLLGTPPDPAFIREVYEFVGNYPDVAGIHDVMVHDYGPGRKFVSFHAEVPSDCNVTAAHDTIDKIERDMLKRFGCLVTIHLDPIEVNNERVTAMRTLAETAAREVDSRFTIHDFRMTDGGKHINMIFDLVVPADLKSSASEAAKAVAAKIQEKNPDCFAVINAEHPFV